MRSLILVTYIALFPLSAIADEPLSLKGLLIGTPLNGCPEGTLSEQKTPKGETMCSLGPTTLANQQATDHVVVFKNNKISGVMFQLDARGRYANKPVIEAFRSKYGEPTRKKEHLNSYVWQQGTLTLSVDGWAGTVLLVDFATARQTDKEAAEKNKDDL